MNIILRKRPAAAMAAGILAVCMAAYVILWPATAGAYATDRQLPIYSVERDQKVCSVSFDAAWGNEDTQQLIDILGKYNIKATFFVVGDWVTKYPESVKALRHSRPLQLPLHRGDHCRPPGLQRQDQSCDRRGPHPDPVPLRGV